MFHILVVEDDRALRELFCTVLSKNGFVYHEARDGVEAWDVLEKQYIDLVVTDIMMPNMNGFEFVKSLRQNALNMPVLIITAKDNFEDMQSGFLAGTDDYMVKPVDEEELLLRVKALLRRAKIVSERKITIGKVSLNYDSLTVSRESEGYTLPQKEFMLLYKLLSYPDTIFTRMQLMDEIWGYDTQTDEHTVSVHISRLRERFSAWPEFDILTVRGLGYKAVKNED